MASTTRVSVPKSAGDEIVVSWDGDAPKTYKVTDGHVAIENENVDRFLTIFEGSKVTATEAASSGSTK